MFVSPAFAQAAGGAAGGSAFGQLLILPVVFAIMYFLMIRPQQKKMKEAKAMVDALLMLGRSAKCSISPAICG